MIEQSLDRCLIVNADDLGFHEAVDRGILTAHEHGIVTSTSLMVRGQSAAQATEHAKRLGRLSVGLHVDLGEWVLRRGQWLPRYQVVDLEDAGAVAAEISRQFKVFRDLMGRDPSHLDSHQHVHRNEPVRSILLGLARKLGVPLRGHSRAQYNGTFFGQGKDGQPLPWQTSADALNSILCGLAPGVTELCCHPGEVGNYESDYKSERTTELQAICDPSVRRTVHDKAVQLLSFVEARACGLVP